MRIKGVFYALFHPLPMLCSVFTAGSVFEGVQRVKKSLRHRIWYIWPKVALPLLAMVWCFGLLFGILAALRCQGIGANFYGAARMAPSLWEMLSACVGPFLFSGLAVYLRETWLLLFVCGAKAFSFGFCSFGVILAFGQGSWLVRFLFLFSDCLLIPVLFLYWVRHLYERRSDWELFLCLIAALMVFSFDFWVISPFLVSILG
ncbi:MAG: hypothetical protein IJV82_04965 [Oscillospiraceae bacterium]|nr:hypothetical protein [Oscillospiraceae bacterium]